MRENGLSILPDVITSHRADIAMQNAATEGYNEAMNSRLPRQAVLYEEPSYDSHDYRGMAQMEGRE